MSAAAFPARRTFGLQSPNAAIVGRSSATPGRRTPPVGASRQATRELGRVVDSPDPKITSRLIHAVCAIIRVRRMSICARCTLRNTMSLFLFDAIDSFHTRTYVSIISGAANYQRALLEETWVHTFRPGTLSPSTGCRGVERQAPSPAGPID